MSQKEEISYRFLDSAQRRILGGFLVTLVDLLELWRGPWEASGALWVALGSFWGALGRFWDALGSFGVTSGGFWEL